MTFRLCARSSSLNLRRSDSSGNPSTNLEKLGKEKRHVAIWAQILKHFVEAEKLRKSFFSKVRVYNRAWTEDSFCVLCAKSNLCKQLGKIKIGQNDSTSVFYIKNILRRIWKPWIHTFSLAVISKYLGIQALERDEAWTLPLRISFFCAQF